MTLLSVRGLSKSFGQDTDRGNSVIKVVDGFDLDLHEGELLTLFGPNGCGKTTLLNLIAGLVPPDAGEIQRARPHDSDSSVGFVFQNYADTLLPWRTVRSNVSLPLEFAGVPPADRQQQVSAWLREFEIEEHAGKFIYELSGGLKQLVAIARSTVYHPSLLLLDEPFSALDYSRSRSLWLRFRKIWADTKVSTMFVSHSVDEAIFLGDRVCVLSRRPARVIEAIEVPLGKERSLDLLTSEKFIDVRRQVLDAFEDGGSA